MKDNCEICKKACGINTPITIMNTDFFLCEDCSVDVRNYIQSKIHHSFPAEIIIEDVFGNPLCIEIEDAGELVSELRVKFGEETKILTETMQLYTNKEPTKTWHSDKSRFAYIVSSCSRYLPELCACLNSLDFVGNKEDVYLLGYGLPSSFTDQFSKLSYNVNYYNIPEEEARLYGGESEILCRKRYWYGAGYGADHDAVCVLDADMYFCRNPYQYFETAAKTGYILGASLEQKRIYGHIEHHKVGGKHLLEKPTWNPKDICCAPMFMDMKKHGELFKECWTIFADGWPDTNFKAPDMESYNLLILAKNMTDEVMLLPNYQWVGTNEKLLKPYTRATVQDDNNLWTESGEPIYVVHGQFYKQRWRKQQLENRHGCAAGYLGFADNSDNMARGALETLYNRFRQMLDHKIQIPKVAYVPNGDMGDSLV